MTTPRHHAAAAPPLAALALLLLLAGPAGAQPPLPPLSLPRDGGGGGGGGAGYSMQNQPPGFSAPMVVLLVALIAAFFFIGFFSVYMRRCGRGATSGGGGPAGIPAAALLALSRQQELQRDNQRQRGLDPAVVASFPTMKYAEAKELRVKDDHAAAAAAPLECAVCLSEFADDEELRFLPPCSHAFHPDCIGEWLAGHVTCPVCRCNLDPDAQELAAADAEAANSSGEVAAAEDRQQDQVVAIDVTGDGEEEDRMRRREEAIELERIGSQRRAMRSRSGRPAVAPSPAPEEPPVPRSHSMGHSLAAARLGGDGSLERFTLRLPEHVRREMVAAGEESLRRAVAAGAGARSARLGRSDRWPSFITRTFSSRVPFWPSGGASRRAPDAEAPAVAAATEASAAAARSKQREKPATDGGAVTTPKGSVRFDCLGVGGGGAAVSAAAGDSETEDEDEEKAIARQA
ncbi:unnamed protein product [Urochloa humidicola]